MAGLDGTTAALSALQRVDFDAVRTLSSVWRDFPADVPELNGKLVHEVVDDLLAATGPDRGGNPRGRVLLGNPGAGKTHLLGALRREVWRRGGWFVLIDLLDVREFWETAAHCYVAALGQPMADGRSQGQVLAGRIGERAHRSNGARKGLLGWFGISRPPRPEQVAADLLAQLQVLDETGSTAHRDVAAAFACMIQGEREVQRAARDWLIGIGTADEELATLRLRPVMPRMVVRGLSWLMALAGPTLCSVDQIDAIVSVLHAEAGEAAERQTVQRSGVAVDGLAGGLMALSEVTQRTLTLLSTLFETWDILESRAIRSFTGRFEQPELLPPIARPETARHLVERRLARSYERAGFAPPYPSWPFRPEAFDGTTGYTPRELLQRCEAHRRRCLQRGIVTELGDFGVPARAALPPPAELPPGPAGAGPDAIFAALLARMAPAAEQARAADAELAKLVLAALEAWAREVDPTSGEERLVSIDIPGLTARLRLTRLGAPEQHVSFCVLMHPNAKSVQARLAEAIRVSGIEPGRPFRHLLVLRGQPWPGGEATAKIVRQFEEAGGRMLFPGDADRAAFAAIRAMREDPPPGFGDWLRERQPIGATAFFTRLRAIMDAAARPPAAPPTAEPRAGPVRPPDPSPPPVPGPIARTAPPPELVPSQPVSSQPVSSQPAPRAQAIPIGTRAADGRPVLLPTGVLPRHTAVIAGAGSGKTVLLRRLVEEAALAGIPSIVIDSNNDLARLGERWPQQPDVCTADDAARAERYFRTAEVAVWTPGRARGNPLSLAPLPDFAALRGDADELSQAVEMAAAGLAAMLPTTGAQGQLRAGVLMGALRHFAASGGSGGLNEFIGLLRELPPEASPIDKAPKLAGEIANALLAEQARNPLLGADAPPLDPAMLLRGAAGRVRVSVVNLTGLPSDAARQEFVGRLLMALFGHIRRHPGRPDQPVLGLLVMDEAQNFAPSGLGTPSRAATVYLARQARKYGLGMVFATQAPRAIDTNVVGNCTTQLFGRINSPQALETIREMMVSRGGAADDLGRLGRGVFYLTTEGAPRPVKVSAPLCLSYHPANPPTEDEVIDLAARGRPGGASP